MSDLAVQRVSRGRSVGFGGLVVASSEVRVCSYVKCGREFQQPIRLTVFSGRSLETYYACPYCFSKVSEDSDEVFGGSLWGSVSAKPSRVEREGASVGEGVGACPHHFGYLKTRSRDSVIPDECLTCPKIVKCMV